MGNSASGSWASGAWPVRGSVSGGVFKQRGEQIGEPGPELGWVVVEEQFGGGAVMDGHDSPGESVGGLQGRGQAGAVDRGGQ